MESVTENWVNVPDEQFYQVSDHGRIRSIDRQVEQVNRWGKVMISNKKGKILTPSNSHGYLAVKMGTSPFVWRVHQLVARAFIGPCPVGSVVNHIDGNKHNNRPENLEYISNSDNVKHAYRTGLLSNKGTTNGHAILNDDKVRQIRSLRGSGTHKQIGEKVGCKTYLVSQVLAGKTWRHVA